MISRTLICSCMHPRSYFNIRAPFDITGSLAEVNQVVNVMEEKLSSCRALVADLQPQLDLSEPAPEETRHPGLMQYRDMLAWDVVQREPDIGQTVPIGKYTPIDLLQVRCCFPCRPP